MKRENILSIEGVNAEVKDILKKFDEAINSSVDEVWSCDAKGEIQGTRRAANEADRLEYIESEWCNTIEKLSKLGIVVNIIITK